MDLSSIITGLPRHHTPSLCASSCLGLLPESSPSLRNQQDKRCLARHIPNPNPGLVPSIPLTPRAPWDGFLPSLGGNQGVSCCPPASGIKLGGGSQTFFCCLIQRNTGNIGQGTALISHRDLEHISKPILSVKVGLNKSQPWGKGGVGYLKKAQTPNF